MSKTSDPPPPHRPSRPPTSRLGRLARLGALGTRALPLAVEGAKRALGSKRTEEEELVAREKMLADAKKTAEAMLKTLGEMKGLPLKLGQMASYIDGLAPPGYEEKFQQVLKKLQDKAPPLSAEAARKVIREELGAVPEEVFASWEPEPFAAASIGQVHRATTRAGEAVAVKVQYPGIDKAIENDLKSLSLLESFASPLARKYQTKETLEEIKAVFLAELDYTREAQNADLFRRIFADTADIVVPHVHHSLTTKRVLTVEYIDGRSYQEVCESGSQEERNAAGATIWRFMFRSLLVHGLLYADPHPGNYRFLGGGKVAFLDYGCVKEIPEELLSGIKRYMRAALDADWEEFDKACVEVLGFDREDQASWDLYRSYTLELLLPLTLRGPYQCSPEGARETVAFLVRGHRNLAAQSERRLPVLPNLPKPPPDLTFMNRLQWGLASVLGGLRTETRFRDLTEPWVRAPYQPLS